MAKENSSNPFLDDDFEEVDDEEFLNPRNQPGYMFGTGSDTREPNELQVRRMQLLEERRRIEERTLQSTNNSLGLLHESEQVGILTAEELVKQREQLENIEENLDTINSSMRTSQKHINSIKSIFGGIKSFFKLGPDSSATVTMEAPPKKPPSNLCGTIDNLKTDSGFRESSHPAFRVRDLPYDETDDAKREFLPAVSPSASKPIPDIEEKLTNNLDFMSLGLGRLKALATDLNVEIAQQNEMIDQIHNKADKADETLEYQNRQIKRILKK